MYFNTDGTTETRHIFSPDGTLLAVMSSTTGEQMLRAGLGVGTSSSGMTAPSEGQSILSVIDGKTASEAADLKATELVNRVPTGDYEDATYGIRVEIEKIEKIDGGVQIFARAWKGDEQLGFGKDGSVEIERFRIFNPPILVEDPNGTIVREWVDPDTNTTKRRTLREDPVTAIRNDLAHTISIVGKEGTAIVAGKIGNTTDILRPDAGHGGSNTSVDGRIVISAQASFAAAHDATAGSYLETDDTGSVQFGQLYRNGGGQYQIGRGFFLFDSSAIGGDTVDSATLSLYAAGYEDAVNDGNDFLSVVAGSPASNNDLVVEDYDQVGTTEMHDTGERKDFTGRSAGWLDFSLNGAGRAAVVNGISKFATREGHDLLNAGYSGEPSAQTEVDGYYADKDGAGTTYDPKLVVEHHHTGQGSPSMRYIHPDHLGGTNVVTDANGDIIQTLDYYPYGSQRIGTGSFDEQRRFIGEEYDPESDLNYLNARYYQSSRGQFMSQDPFFLNLE
jgi:RHS repeat-associated protein